MAKFRVYGAVTVTVWTDVEAETKEDAIEAADNGWAGLSGYAGNGGTSKLIGVCDSSDGIEDSDDFPEWTEAYER